MQRELERQEREEIITVDQIVEARHRPDEQYYAYANYFPPCQVGTYYLQSGHHPDVVFYAKTELETREGEVRVAYKKVKKLRIKREFNLKNSVFREWHVN